MKQRFFLWMVFWLCGVLAAPGWAQVRLSEVMFNPAGSEYTNEFIELFNRSARDSVNLAGWQIGDEKALDPIVDAGNGLVLPPGGFALILDSGYFGHSAQYDSLIPPGALVVTIAGKSFGSGGLSNSVAEQVVLVNSAGDTVDVYRYSPDNSDGYSDEKVNLFEDESEGNWQNSLVFNGTPGFKNSVAVPAADLSLRAVILDSARLFSEKQLFLTCVVVNRGAKPASGFVLNLFLDKNLNGRFESPEEQVSRVVFESDISPGDSATVPFPALPVPPGLWPFQLHLAWPPDENPANNWYNFRAVVPFEVEALTFTEIMYRPEAGRPEWVELKNTTADTLPLFHWAFSDENTGQRQTVFQNPIWLPPEAHVILAQDSLTALDDSLKSRLCCLFKAWPTLNNGGDEVHVWGPAGESVSGVSYAPPEVPVGFSLEKVEFVLPGQNAEQWLPSKLRGGTPGHANSVNPLNTNGTLAESDSLLTVVFGKTVRLTLVLKNRGRTLLSSGKICVTEQLSGKKKRLLLEKPLDFTLAPGDSSQLELGLPALPPGEHLLSANWLVPGDGDSSDNVVHFAAHCGFPERAVLLNEILYAPRPGWPEWVELFNPGQDSVNLTHWALSDSRLLRAKKSAKNPGRFIFPRDFLIVTRDSSFFDFYPNILPGQVWVTKDFPHLGNTADSLFLLDLAGGLVDWLAYRSSWGGQNGYSLERICPENPARDSTNWSTSVAASGATPATQNSVYLHANSRAAFLSISPNPFSPDGDGRDDFVTFSLHLPWATGRATLQIYDPQGHLARGLLSNRPVGSSYEVIWDGRNAEGRTLPVGIYIAFLEVFSSKMERKSTKKVFVLARRN